MRKLTTLTALVALLAGCMPPPLPTVPAGSSEVVHRHETTTWFEEYRGARALSVSPDGGRLVFESRGRAALIDVEHGTLPMEAWAAVDTVTGVIIRPSGDVAVRGRRGAAHLWIERDRTGRLRTIDVPPTVYPIWSPDDAAIAYQEPVGTQWMMHMVTRAGRRVVPLPKGAHAMAWYPDASSLLVMFVDTGGLSSLHRMDAGSGSMRMLVQGLDASPRVASAIAVASDGRHAYVPLASAGAPPRADRHDPHADRDLDIYEVDLATGVRRAIAGTEGDDTNPLLAGNALYWTTASIDASVVTLPVSGGPAHLVVAGGQSPTWHPNGRQLGYFYGDWRLVDWALNWDGGTVQVDSAGRATGTPGPLIVGFHEDFSPVWSPNGRWIAYHSHRSPYPVVSYRDSGSTDDVYLREAGAPLASEIRLTDFGLEAGSPDWSPDGTRLVFTSHDRHGDALRSRPFVIAVDTATGRASGTIELPLPAEVTGAEMVAWSPDGQQLAIQEKMSDTRHALWVVAADGSSGRKLVDYPLRTYGGVDWTADGQTLIYTALTGNRMQLFAIPAAGGTPRRLTSDDAHLLHPKVSPDGRLIAATRLVHRIEVRRMRLGTMSGIRGSD
jgi:Tol biopolymer transport system component